MNHQLIFSINQVQIYFVKDYQHRSSLILLLNNCDLLWQNMFETLLLIMNFENEKSCLSLPFLLGDVCAFKLNLLFYLNEIKK